MWSIRDAQNGQYYNFLTDREYSVGRKGTTIVVDDPSVSRFHAVFRVSFPAENVFDLSQPSVLKLRDTGSKCGTFVNEGSIRRKIKELEINDVIRFGTLNSEFIVCYEPLVVCTSGLDEEKKDELKPLLFILGGHFSEEWVSDCTHLVMPCVTITIKAIVALVSLRPLVSFDFFADLVQCWTCRSVERRLEEKCYIPPFPETQPCEEMSIFNINMDRTTVFQDKSFFFLEENQFKKLQFIILTAGGRASLLKKTRRFNPELLVGPDACIVKPSTESDELLVPSSEISDLLSRNKKRLVPEFDLAMAVIYCSTDQFCNPDYDSNGATRDGTYRIASQTFSQNHIFAENTEEIIHARTPSEKYFSFRNPTPGTSKDAHIDFIEIEDSQDSLFEKKQINSDDDDDDIIFEYSSIEEQSSKKKMETNDSDDEPEVLLAKVNVPDKKGFITVFDGNNFESKEPRFSPHSPPCIDIPDDDLPTVSQDKMSPLKEKNAAECQEPESDISNNGGNLNMHSNLQDCQNPSGGEPSSLTKVQFTNLVKQTASEVKENAACNEDQNTGIRNFKRFKKVLHSGTPALPRIIGGRDLVPHDPLSSSESKPVSGWIQDHPEENHKSEEKGEFDWDSPSLSWSKF